MAWYVSGGKITQGEEFNNGIAIKGCTISYSKCEYCFETVISVKDRARRSPYPYLGNQAVIASNYMGSPAIEAIRKFYNVGWEDFENKILRRPESFTQFRGNNLLNVHSRLHVRKVGEKRLLPSWHYENGDTYKTLCNNCFAKTHKRVSVKGPNNLIYEVTVLAFETVEEVVKQCKIKDVTWKDGYVELAK